MPPFPLPHRSPMEPLGPQAASAAPAPAPSQAPPRQASAPHLAQPIPDTDLQFVVRTTVAEVLREQAEVRRPDRLTPTEYMDRYLKCKVPEFDGSLGGIEVMDWLLRVEKVLNAIDVPDSSINSQLLSVNCLWFLIILILLNSPCICEDVSE